PGTSAGVVPIELTQGKTLMRKRFSSTEDAIQWLEVHPDTFVELTLVSDTYIDAKSKKVLYAAHSGIVSIIPEIIRPQTEADKQPRINLQDNLSSLFSRYFEYKREQTPNDELMTLFREVIENEEV
ncbi:MAG: exonuclease sbcCD subunit D, partial [Bacteroidota bacterium]